MWCWHLLVYSSVCWWRVSVRALVDLHLLFGPGSWQQAVARPATFSCGFPCTFASQQGLLKGKCHGVFEKQISLTLIFQVSIHSDLLCLWLEALIDSFVLLGWQFITTLNNYFLVSVHDRQTFLGFQIISNSHDTSPFNVTSDVQILHVNFKTLFKFQKY